MLGTVLIVLAVLFFLLDAFKGYFKALPPIAWTPLAFACIAVALWLL